MSAPEPPPFSVDVTDSSDGVLLTVRGELDLATAPELEAALLPPVHGGRRAVVDLRDLEFMDSTGVRVLVAAHHAAEEHGTSFALVRPVPDSAVGRVLEVSGLDTILALVDEP